MFSKQNIKYNHFMGLLARYGEIRSVLTVETASIGDARLDKNSKESRQLSKERKKLFVCWRPSASNLLQPSVWLAFQNKTRPCCVETTA